MNHAAAQNLDPAGTLTETAAGTSALETGYIHLGARLREREMVRTELYLCLRPEQLLGKLRQRSL